MKLLKALEKKSIRWIFSVCYISLIATIVATYLFVDIKSVGILKEEINTNRINSFSIFRRDFDELLYYDYEAIDYMKTDKTASELASIDIYGDKNAVMKRLLDVRNGISKIETKSRNPIKIYVFFPMVQKCVSSMGISNAEDFYNFSFLDKDGYSNWCTDVLSDSVTSVKISEGLWGLESDKSTESIMITDALRTHNGNVYCSVIFCIPNSTVETMIKECGINPKSNNIIVSNFTGEEVVNIGDNVAQSYDWKSLSVSGDGFTEIDDDISVNKYKSQVKNLTYINYMPVSVYYESLRLQKMIIIFSAIILSISGALIMFVFYKHQYNNMHDVMTELSLSDKYRNEFNVIKNSIKRINEENRNLKDFKQIASDFARDAVFYKLTAGEFGIDSLEQNALEAFGICFDEPNFAIVCFKWRRTYKNIGTERLSYLGGMLLELVEADFSHFYTYNLDDCFCIIFNLSAGEAQNFECICGENLENIREDEDYDIKNSYITAVSGIYSGNTALYEAQQDISLKLQLKLTAVIEEATADDMDSDRANPSIEDKIDEFIYANYSDYELSLQLIADAFNMNPVYLSNIYKKRRNKGILTSITECRIEKAKELLSGGKVSVAEAAVKVGYLYPKNFSRVFKKYCGISPNEFKKNEASKNKI